MNENEKRKAIKIASEALRECIKLGIFFSLQDNENGQIIGFEEKEHHLAMYSYNQNSDSQISDKLIYNSLAMPEPMFFSESKYLNELSNQDEVYLLVTYKGNNHKKVWGAFATQEEALNAIPVYNKFYSINISSVLKVTGNDLYYWLRKYR